MATIRRLQRSITHLFLTRATAISHPTWTPRPFILAPRLSPLPSLHLRPHPQSRKSSTSAPAPRQPLPHRPAPHRNPNEPVYELTFTCRACTHRSAHTVSKQGYHKGTILITCPGCKSRHLIADHLRIFSDSAVTLEDLLKNKGEEVQRGAIDEQGDIEFWSPNDVREGGERV